MTKKKIQLLLLIIFSSSFFFCKTKTMDKNKENSKEIITFENKEVTTETYNQDKSKVLILNYTMSKSPINFFNYKVIDVETRKELKAGVFTGEKIEWLDVSTLKCTKHVGMIMKEDDRISSSTKPKNKNYITIKIN